MNSTVKLFDRFGPICSDGDRAFQLLKVEILPLIEKGEQVQIDMTAVRHMNSCFSNALFAKLAATRGESVLRSLIIMNCSSRLKPVIESALFFGMNHKELARQ